MQFFGFREPENASNSIPKLNSDAFNIRSGTLTIFALTTAPALS